MTQQHPDEGTGEGAVLQSPAGGPFLVSKLEVPPLPVSWVPRPRLHARLDDGVAGPLTVLSAGAGTGKTLLAASWVLSGAAPGPVVWLTLDEDDDDPQTFWFSVLQALHHHEVGLPADPETLAHPGPPDRSFLAGLAYGLAERGEPLVLVLDEFDTVADRGVTGGLDFVLRRSGHGLRLVLLGRHDPLLPLHRYRLRDELVEVRADDLALTRAETEQMLAAHGVSLSADSVAALLDRTEGWVVGVRLTAMALQARTSQRGGSDGEQVTGEQVTGEQDAERFVAEFATDDTTIPDYLVGEVLDAQPPHVRDLLLATSMTERVHPGLADVLTGASDSTRTLAALERGNAFISHIPSAPGWYRYHQLFRDVLRAQLAYERPELVPELHRRAARWLADAGLADEAVAHAAAAGEWSLACALVVDHLAVGTLLSGRQRARVLDELAAMPADEPGVDAEVVRAALALAASDLDACAEALARADAALGGATTAPHPEVRLAASVLGAVLSRLRGDPRLAVTAARRARALMQAAPLRRLDGHHELGALLASAEGSALTWTGDLAGAEQVLSTAAPGDLAFVEAVRGHLRRGGELGHEALAGYDDDGGLFAHQQLASAYLALAWVATEEYELAAAREHADQAARAAAAGRDPLLASGLGLVRGRLLRLHGEYAAARHALAAAGQRVSECGVDGPPAWLARQIALGEVSVRLAEAAPDEALRALESLADDSVEYVLALTNVQLATGEADRARATLIPVLERVDGSDPLPLRVEALLLDGRLHVESSEFRQAAQAAASALRLAQPERLRRPFVEQSGWLRHLFRHDQALADAHAWLGHRVVPHPRTAPDSYETGAANAEALMVEPLSAREREVLALVAQMMSTEEIAEALFLSHNTVKTHLKSIYRKLSASRRGEAVRRARRLGLL